MDIEKLAAPFPLEEVKVRAGALSKDRSRCVVLHYVEARTVMRRLDEVFGPLGWGTRLTHMVPSGQEEVKSGDGVKKEDIFAVGLELYVFLPNGMIVSKSDTGLGSDYKNATSDALKRAAVQFGIARYLYEFPVMWADYDPERRIPVNIKPLSTSVLPDGAQTAQTAQLAEPKSSGVNSMPAPLGTTDVVCPKCNKPLNKAGLGWLENKRKKDSNFATICPPCYSLQGKAAQ